MNPLPLIDGCLFIDNSTLEYLQTCPRSAEYFVLNNRISAGDKPALNFGGSIHGALEHRHKHYPATFESSEQMAFCSAEIDTLLDKWYVEKPNPIDDHRQPGLAKQVMQGYLEQYKDSELQSLTRNGEPLVESSFAVPLTTLVVAGVGTIRLIFTGRIDRVVVEGDHIWLVDTKTSSIMGEGFIKEQKMSLQWKGYCYAFKRVTGILPYGVIIDGVRVRRPNKTEAGRAKRPDVIPDDFQRYKLILESHHLDEWAASVISQVDHFLRMYVAQYYPMHTKWCVGKYGACQYYEVCELPPENRAAMLSSGLFVTNTWSPLEQIKQEKQKTK